MAVKRAVPAPRSGCRPPGVFSAQTFHGHPRKDGIPTLIPQAGRIHSARTLWWKIRSTSDNLAPLHAKMRLYIQNGALLGWLIDARNRRVYIYRTGQAEAGVAGKPAYPLPARTYCRALSLRSPVGFLTGSKSAGL